MLTSFERTSRSVLSAHSSVSPVMETKAVNKFLSDFATRLGRFKYQWRFASPRPYLLRKFEDSCNGGEVRGQLKGHSLAPSRLLPHLPRASNASFAHYISPSLSIDVFSRLSVFTSLYSTVGFSGVPKSEIACPLRCNWS